MTPIRVPCRLYCLMLKKIIKNRYIFMFHFIRFVDSHIIYRTIHQPRAYPFLLRNILVVQNLIFKIPKYSPKTKIFKLFFFLYLLLKECLVKIQNFVFKTKNYLVNTNFLKTLTHHYQNLNGLFLSYLIMCTYYRDNRSIIMSLEDLKATVIQKFK